MGKHISVKPSRAEPSRHIYSQVTMKHAHKRFLIRILVRDPAEQDPHSFRSPQRHRTPDPCSWCKLRGSTLAALPFDPELG
jgi:hypothetical protein